MQPTKLVDKMHRDKSTISYHLQELSSTGMVEFDKEGRSTFYRVKEALEPYIQMRIAKEGEIHEYA
jgi:predicted transcriptional regulator